MWRLSSSDIQYRHYLHMLPWEDSVNDIYNTDLIYICYHEKTQFIRYTIPALSTYATMRRLSSSDIQYQPYLHILPWEDSVNQIYNTDHIYICYHEKTQAIRHTISTLFRYVTMKTLSQSEYNTDLIYIYITMIRLSQSDIQYRPYLHILPMRRLSQSDIQYRPYLHMLPWEDSVDQIYNTDPIYIYYHEKTKFIRYTIPTLSTYVTLGWLSRSDVQYRPYQHMLPWEDSVDQIGNAGPIYICHDAKTQSIRYTILTLYTNVWMKRPSSSDIQYRIYVHMLPW
jgi:hypothetical protein